MNQPQHIQQQINQPPTSPQPQRYHWHQPIQNNSDSASI
jgi:hypothetical protein